MKKLKIIFVSIVIIMLLTSNFSVFAYQYNHTENQTVEEKSGNETKNENTIDDEDNQNNENTIEDGENQEEDEEVVKDDETEETIKDDENETIEDETGNALEDNKQEDTNTTNETSDETIKSKENETVNQKKEEHNKLPKTDLEVQTRAGKQTIADGVYEIELALDSNKVVEVIDATKISGGNVQVFKRNNAKCQIIQ